MNHKEVKINDRLYHAVFGWCKVTHPATLSEKVLVDIEADEIEYYVIGKGKITSKRENGDHYLYTSTEDLFKNESEVTKAFELKKMALNPTLIFWDNEKEANT